MDLKIFQNSEFGELRILIIDGKEYFPATQCAKILGYKNPRDAVIRHCKSEGVVKHDGVSSTINQRGVASQQIIETKYISEGNLYRLIIRSKLPAAEKFEHWVFDEVLPELRKNGSYGNNVNLEEIIAKTATAVVSEVMKLIMPVTSSLIESEPKRRAKKYKYTQPSKIETLNPELKAKVDDMIASGDYSCQQIANFIMNNCDMYISQMSVNKYKRKYFVVDDSSDLQLSIF